MSEGSEVVLEEVRARGGREVFAAVLGGGLEGGLEEGGAGAFAGGLAEV